MEKLDRMDAKERYYVGAALIGSLEAILQNKEMQRFEIVPYDVLLEVFEDSLNVMEIINNKENDIIWDLKRQKESLGLIVE